MTPRVLLIAGSLGTGGAELAMMAMVRGFADRGTAAPVVALLGSGGGRGEDLRREGVPVRELRLEGRLRTPRGLARVAGLGRLVQRERIDIVHTFLFDADVYGMLGAHLGRPRATITTRRSLKTRKPHHLRAYRATSFLVDRIVANSEAVRRFTLEREKAPPGKVVTIPNGVDADRLASGDREGMRARLGAGAREILVGALGTVKEVKGQSVLVEAMRPLLEARPELRLVLAGRVSAGYGDDLRSSVAGGGLESRVLMPGNVDQVPDLLAALDVFVLPSLSEGMSNALLEAMAAGKPIVATDVGGNAENLAGGEAGLLVPPREPGALRRALGHLLDSEDRRRELSERAALRARAEYSLERMLARTEALYESVLDGKPL